MKKFAKVMLVCSLSVGVVIPSLVAPIPVEAAAQKYFTQADKEYMNDRASLLYTLRNQTEDFLNLLDSYQDYEEQEFYLAGMDKLDAWDENLLKIKKYQPQNVPLKFKKAHQLFLEAAAANVYSYSILRAVGEGKVQDYEIEDAMNEVMRGYDVFRKKSAAFSVEIKRVSKIYK